VSLLRVDSVTTYYGEIRILEDVSLEVGEGELVCLLGGNASGKSTTLKTILGLVRPRAGTVEFAGRDVTGEPTSGRIARGMAIVPENRRLFARSPSRRTSSWVLTCATRGGLARGGLPPLPAPARAAHPARRNALRRRAADGCDGAGADVQAQPPAHGRAVDGARTHAGPQTFDIRRVNEEGVAVLVVEQNANMSLRIADRGYVLQTGSIVLADSAASLLESEDLKRAYLGA
jgi:branched-chain amino acid transport system ATP-binding protein